MPQRTVVQTTAMPLSQPPHPVYVTIPAPMQTRVQRFAPAANTRRNAPGLSLDRIPDHVVLDRGHGATPPALPETARSPIVLEGRYPQPRAERGAELQVERDEIERIRIARDLGTIGGASSARALLDGVRTGVLSPTIASDQLERGGFEAGIAVAAALRDPEPRVRSLATSLVHRSAPLEPARITSQELPPMPDPPTDPRT